MRGKPYYLPEVKDGMPTGAYTINPEIVAMGLSLRSLYLVSQCIPFSDAEAQAIAYHDGMYVPEGRSVAHREEPLLAVATLGGYVDGEREGEINLNLAPPSTTNKYMTKLIN